MQFAPPNDTLTPISGSELNQASIAIGSLPGIQTVSRHVRNVGSAATYTASSNVPGFDVTVDPFDPDVGAGRCRDVHRDVLSNNGGIRGLGQGFADLDRWRAHRCARRSRSGRSRSRPRQRCTATRARLASSDFTVTPGFTGSLGTTVSGLVGVTPTADSVGIGPFDTTAPVADADTDVYHVVVPAGTRAARFSLDADASSDDLDLFVYKGGTDTLVDLSASSSGDEQVTLIDPAAGTYDVYVNGFAGVGAYHISNFVVPAASAGNGTVTPNPDPVTQGTPSTLSANWTGLDPAKRWFGVINYTTTNVFTYFSVG